VGVRIRWSLSSIAVMLIVLSSCSMGEKIEVAKDGVGKLHAQINAKQFDAILNNASREFRDATTVEQNRKLFGAVEKRLGYAGEWSVTNWFVNSSTSGTIVKLQCKTKFALGEARESFVWRITGSTASLLRYDINSLALISE